MGVSLKTHQKGLFLPFPNPLTRPEPSAHQSTIYRVGNVGLARASSGSIRLVFSNGIMYYVLQVPPVAQDKHL